MAISQYTWADLTSSLIRGEDLSEVAATWAMNQVMTGTSSPVQLAGFLIALRAKGETVAEMTGLANAMVAHAVAYPDLAASAQAVDIVGSGGDRLHTVNISTMASLVIAGTGIPVVKHGNRALVAGRFGRFKPAQHHGLQGQHHADGQCHPCRGSGGPDRGEGWNYVLFRPDFSPVDAPCSNSPQGTWCANGV